MNRLVGVVAACVLFFQDAALIAQDWKPVSGHLLTPWAETVNPNRVWPEYPRPQLVRKEWMNLNGLWDFALVLGTNQAPSSVLYERKILVPFCVESALSGLKLSVGANQEMWYRRFFFIPEGWKGKRILLNFQAVDYEARIWVNGVFIGTHKGGYDAFHFDITDALGAIRNHELCVAVWDPSDAGTQPIGKQAVAGVSKGNYTATSGIYQTVWLEPVSAVSIDRIKVTPDSGLGAVSIETILRGWEDYHVIKVRVFDHGKQVAFSEGNSQNPIVLKIDRPKLWSPDSPFLYDLKVSLHHRGQVIDEVESYFGMRRISMARDAAGFLRILLNRQEIFQFGPLDQGYWPDGLLTPPSDQALQFDVDYLKKTGCNMDRVHIKVQPERFYYHCDKAGILLWQDMISPASHLLRSEVGGGRTWELEWAAIIDQLYNHPSIVQWIVFNESWGQFDTERITDWTKRKDPTRLVTNASGWIDRECGDIRDFHDYTLYPSVGWVPAKYPRAMVLGEAGGHEFAVNGHLWQPDLDLIERIDRAGDLIREVVLSAEDLDERYSLWIDNLSGLREYGLTSVVYTQLSDVENELNGWLTYDRQVSKLPVERLAELHGRLFQPLTADQKSVIPLSMSLPQEWMYLTEALNAGWYKQDNRENWRTGLGPFGVPLWNVPDVRTLWNSGMLYLQRDFTLAAVPAEWSVVLYNHGVTDLYINGEHALQINNLRRWDPEIKVSRVWLPKKATALLKEGSNHLAIKYEFGCIVQTSVYGPQATPSYFFDMGLFAH